MYNSLLKNYYIYQYSNSYMCTIGIFLFHVIDVAILHTVEPLLSDPLGRVTIRSDNRKPKIE